MRRLLFTLSLIPCLCMAQTSVLADFFSKAEQHTLESAFSITIQDDATQPMTYTGRLQMRGEQFIVSVMGIEAAYDGHTLYTYSEDTEELTLSSPTLQELTEANPLLFAKALADNCRTTVKERTDSYVLTLVPNEKVTGVQSFTLTLGKPGLLPLGATMKETLTRRTVLTFTNPRYNNERPSFRLDKPGAYVNDLR